MQGIYRTLQMKRSRDWSGIVQQVYNNFTIMGALNLDFIEILIILSPSVQLPVVTCNKIIIAMHKSVITRMT